jgi:hypothetical protein
MPEKRAELLAYSLDVTTVGKVPGWPELFSENASELWVSAHPIVVLTSQSCQGTERYASARDPPSFSRTGPLGHGTIGPGLLVEAEAGCVNRAGPAEEGPSGALEFLAHWSATGWETGPTGGIRLGADRE